MGLHTFMGQPTSSTCDTVIVHGVKMLKCKQPTDLTVGQRPAELDIHGAELTIDSETFLIWLRCQKTL